MPDTTEPVYRSLFIVEAFTVGLFDPYAEMDHYDGDERHISAGRDLSEILSDTYEHGIPTRYYQVAAHSVPDSIGEWAAMAREHANVAEMSYGYRDGVPYALGGAEPIEPVTGVVHLADLWRWRDDLRGVGNLVTCVCGLPIIHTGGAWQHIFDQVVLENPPREHDPRPRR